MVQQHAGRPEEVARALVRAANDAGGKDNITVVYVEGERFGKKAIATRSNLVLAPLLVLAGLSAGWAYAGYPIPDRVANWLISRPAGGNTVLVKAGGSIGTALATATPGTTILVEPGEYRERLTLRSDVRLLSLVSRGAVLRLPGTATDEDALVVAANVRNAELAGFRIVGDAATPLGTGVVTRSAEVRLIDLEITGAARAAVDLGSGENVMLIASDIHDNPGTGLALRTGAAPRITHNVFSGNGISAQAASAVLVETGSRPFFQGNTFWNTDPQAFKSLDPASRTQVKNMNWFPR